MSVILFHLFPKLLPGGFVGVDIFFVISGFLICQLLQIELDNKTLSFKDFYLRRIKRLLPSLIFVSFITFIGAYFILIPNDLKYFMASLFSAWLYASNIFFSLLSGGYFEQRQELFPFLHTWSLSVEEQFYLVFPILLFFISKTKKHVFWIIILFLIFLIISEFHPRNTYFYFSSITRAFEFLLGALTYLLSTKINFSLNKNKIVYIEKFFSIEWIGIILIFISLFYINRKTDFPGINALLPTLGTVFILFSDKKSIFKNFLSSKPMVFVGLISYSLYLCHWPIIAFTKYVQIEITSYIGILIILISFLLSVFSYKYIEVPCRKNKLSFWNNFYLFYFSPAIISLLLFLITQKTNGMLFRYTDDVQKLISSYTNSKDLSRICTMKKENSSEINKDLVMKECAIRDLSQTKVNFILFGDSHANHFKKTFNKLGIDAKIKGIYLVKGSCNLTNLKSSECKSFIEAVRSFYYTQKISNIVIGGNWVQKKDSYDYMEKLALEANRLNLNMIIMKEIPMAEKDVSKCPLFKVLKWKGQLENCDFKEEIAIKNNLISDTMIDEIKRKTRITVLDPKEFFCRNGLCKSELNNFAVYQDISHINDAIAEEYANFLIQNKMNVFLIP